MTATRPAGQHTVRRHNRALVLRTVATDEPVSRARIAAVTGLTRGTVSSLVEELIAAGPVELQRAGGTAGRAARRGELGDEPGREKFLHERRHRASGEAGARGDPGARHRLVGGDGA